MVFIAKMQDSKTMKGIIDALAAIIDETYFVANADTGLNLTAMDESHICLMHMLLSKEFFDEFTCDEEVKMGINLEDLVKVSKRAGASDSIELSHKVDSEKFQMILRGRGTRTFSLRLVDIDEEKIPPTAELDVDFDTTFTIDVGILEEAIKDSEIYQDTLEFKISAEGAKFSAEGEVGDVCYELDKDKLESFSHKTDARGVFSLAFLKNIMKVSAIADKVTLSLADNAPLKFEFEIGTEEKKGKVVYFLAPRVESEDENYESD